MVVHAATVRTDQWVGAGTAILVAVVVVWILRHLFARRAKQGAAAVLREDLGAAARTRIALLERLVYAVVLGVGVAIALSRFDALRTLGTTILTSSAIAAAIVGFAARQTLANVVAGLMIAVTQPLRIGDHVELEDVAGVVEDVTLSYTVLRTGPGRRVVVPNDTVVSAVLRNDSLAPEALAVATDVWLRPDADVGAATRALAGDVLVAEATPAGIRLEVTDGTALATERNAREADLRARCLQVLSQAGLLPPSP